MLAHIHTHTHTRRVNPANGRLLSEQNGGWRAREDYDFSFYIHEFLWVVTVHLLLYCCSCNTIDAVDDAVVAVVFVVCAIRGHILFSLISRQRAEQRMKIINSWATACVIFITHMHHTVWHFYLFHFRFVFYSIVTICFVCVFTSFGLCVCIRRIVERVNSICFISFGFGCCCCRFIWLNTFFIYGCTFLLKCRRSITTWSGLHTIYWNIVVVVIVAIYLPLSRPLSLFLSLFDLLYLLY